MESNDPKRRAALHLVIEHRKKNPPPPEKAGPTWPLMPWRGNLSLRLGRVLTAEALEAKREKLRERLRKEGKL